MKVAASLLMLFDRCEEYAQLLKAIKEAEIIGNAKALRILRKEFSALSHRLFPGAGAAQSN